MTIFSSCGVNQSALDKKNNWKRKETKMTGEGLKEFWYQSPVWRRCFSHWVSFLFSVKGRDLQQSQKLKVRLQSPGLGSSVFQGRQGTAGRSKPAETQLVTAYWAWSVSLMSTCELVWETGEISDTSIRLEENSVKVSDVRKKRDHPKSIWAWNKG